MEILAPRVKIPDNGSSNKYDLYGVTPWVNLPLATGWSNVANYATAQYRLLPGGRVALKGMISKTALISAGETIVATGGLPAGFRPAATRGLFMAVSSTLSIGLQEFQIKADGSIIYQGATISLTTVRVSLEAIEFDAEV